MGDLVAVEADGVVPENLLHVLPGDGLVQEGVHGAGEGSVGMGVVGVEDDVLAVHVLHGLLESALVGVAGDEALSLEVFGGHQADIAVGFRVGTEEDALASFRVVVETGEPEGEPAGVGLIEGGLEVGVLFEDAAVDHAAES